MDNTVIPSERDRNEKPTMTDLHSNIVIQYAAQWEKLGLELGLKPNDIAIISENNADHSRSIEVCCAAVLKEWLRKISSPTWGKLDDAVKKLGESPTKFSAIKDMRVLGSTFWTQRDLEQIMLSMNQDTLLPEHLEADVLQSVVILLVTGNINEISAIRSYLKPLNGHEHVYRFNQGDQQNGFVIYYIGNYGIYPVAVRKFSPSLKTSVSTVSVMADQYFPNLNAIISVGVACGLQGKVRILDILVSSKIIEYDKVNERYSLKGETVSVPSDLRNMFSNVIQWPNDAVKKLLNDNGVSKPYVKCGTFLSGPYPDNQIKLKASFKKAAPEALAMEIEGTHLFTATEQTIPNTIIVKAVCDFGDSEIRKIYQPTAALLAADLVYKSLSDSKMFNVFTAKKQLRQMVQQAKNEGLTINVRHGKILFCGASRAGKTSFYRLLRKKCHKNVESTPVGHTKQVLISEKHILMSKKVNVVGTNWVDLDSKLETETLTKILVLKLQKPLAPKITETTANAVNVVSPEQITTALPSNKSASDELSVPTKDTKLAANDVPSNDQSITMDTYSKSINPQGINLPDIELDKKTLVNQPSIVVADNLQVFTENEMATHNESVTTPVSELEKTIPDTWDLFTLLDTGGQPEFVNLLPAINASTAITFVVLNMSKGKDCLDTPVIAQYKCEGCNYGRHKLNYTNMHLLKCLLSSIRVTTIQKQKIQGVVKVIKEDDHPQPVVCIIGTHADKIQENFADVIHHINIKISQLEMVKNNDNKVLVIWSDCKGNYIQPVDNTISREPEQKATSVKRSVMPDIQEITIKTVQNIRDKSKELLEKKVQYEIPISWFILELEVRAFCKSNGKVCISINDIKIICDRIMPPERKMEKWVIIEVMKFYNMFGTLLFFDGVKGMNEFVITDPQWLFTNLTRIVTCQFDENQGFYDANIIKKLRNEGICNADLLRKLNLNLQDIKLESFLNLLVDLKVIAPKDSNYEEFFIPSVLPTHDSKIDINSIFDKQFGKAVVFTGDGNSIKINPLLIGFTFGTIPRGLFGFLVVQLLQDNPKSYRLYSESNPEEDKYYCYADLITFQIDYWWYVTLVDKISYLEVQIRVLGSKKPSYHSQVQKTVTEALQKVCKKFDWQFSDCRYGFLCERCRNLKVNHLSMLSTEEPIPSYIPDDTYCSSRQPMELNKEQKIWFEEVKGILQQHDDDMKSKRHVQITKKVYEDFRMDLLTSLPMEDVIFCGLLRQHNLLSTDLQEHVQARSTNAEKVEYFLNKAIESSLYVDDCKPFNDLLTVMSELRLNSDPLKQLAFQIHQEIDNFSSATKYSGNKHLEIILQVYESFRMQLITSLPVDDVVFLGLLRKNHLFSADLNNRVKEKPTTKQKNDLFLDKAIERPLLIGDFKPLNKLLTVMSDESDFNSIPLKKLAAKIKKEISEVMLDLPTGLYM